MNTAAWTITVIAILIVAFIALSWGRARRR